ncbi:MAG: hypothetical protein GX285_05305, partial [Clostridiales bacterium]|nr:hypothetical protein [Clostridiales bacterium]
ILSSEVITTKNVDINMLSPMMKEIYDYMQQYPDDIVLTRVGDFFEAYFEDAIEVSRLTGITLTAKTLGKKEERLNIPMAGVPHRTLNDYASRLVDYNKRIVVVEQLEDPKSVKAGQLVKRGVVRIITSSTVVEDGFIDDHLNNYLCVICKIGHDYGICFSDISTGEIFMTSTDSVDGVLNELSRYKPSELLVNNECFLLFNESITRKLKLHINITIKDSLFKVTDIFSKIESAFKIDSIDKIQFNHVSELHSLYVLLSYVEYTQCISVDYGSLPVSYTTDSFMSFDMDTRRNLELCENIIDRKKQGTLLSVLDKTGTVMGSRLLRQWIEKPLISKSKIESRLGAVEELLNNLEICENIRGNLEFIYDISRIMGRLKLNKSVPRDLICLRESLKKLPEVKSELSKLTSPLLIELYNEFNTFEDLCFLLEQSICDEPVSDIREGLVIKSGYNKELDKARDMLSNSNKYLMELEEREKESTGIKNLKVTNVGGVCTIEITKSNLNKVPSNYIVEKSMKTRKHKAVNLFRDSKMAARG